MEHINKRLLREVLNTYPEARDSGLYLGMVYAKLQGVDIKYKEVPDTVDTIQSRDIELYDLSYVKFDTIDNLAEVFKEYLYDKLKSVNLNDICNIHISDEFSLSYDLVVKEGEYTLGMLQDHNRVVNFINTNIERIKDLYTGRQQIETTSKLSDAERLLIEYKIEELQGLLIGDDNNEH